MPCRELFRISVVKPCEHTATVEIIYLSSNRRRAIRTPENVPMLNRPVILFAFMCTVFMMCGRVALTCAEWRGPIVIPQQPQFPQPQLQQPMTMPKEPLKSTLPSLPPAPQVVTGNSHGDFGTGSGHDDLTDGQTKTGSRREPVHSTETGPSQVSQPPATESGQARDIAEKPELPSSEPSNRKTPWLLAAGVAVVAFLLGRRTRRAGPKR